MDLYNSIISISPSYYLPQWYLYLELIETRKNIEKFNFYSWYLIEDEPEYEHIFILSMDFENNYELILNIVKNIIINNTNKQNGYYCVNDKIIIEQWKLDNQYQCNNCGNIWDGYSQCNC
jgi:hypothetical protein